ncbi:hypothetical protein QTP88_010818 [Uroleucon formosanum]
MFFVSRHFEKETDIRIAANGSSRRRGPARRGSSRAVIGILIQAARPKNRQRDWDLNRAAPRRVYRRVHRNHTFILQLHQYIYAMDNEISDFTSPAKKNKKGKMVFPK